MNNVNGLVMVPGGYYSTVTDYGLRVLGLNTNLYYNMDKVTVMIWDPASQFEWMWNQLVDARQHNQMVSGSAIED